MDSQKAKELISGLRNEGFEVKIPFSKASFHQAKIESIIGSFKTAFRATQLPGSSPLSIVTFIIVIRRCSAFLNSRPIAILPPSLADPDEILSVSPASLTGPASSTWWSLGSSSYYARATGLDSSSPVEVQDKVEDPLHQQTVQQQEHGNSLSLRAA